MIGGVYIVKIPAAASSVPKDPTPVVETVGNGNLLGKVGGVFNLLFGAISGYELGNTTVSKIRGHWTPGYSTPLTGLVVTVAATALVSGPASLGLLGMAVGTGLAIGAFRGLMKKAPTAATVFSNFDQYQAEFGHRPAECNQDTNILKNKAPWNKTDAATLVWKMMEKACQQGEGFTNGTFVLEEEAGAIYEKLAAIDGAYSRHSSHFKGRIVDGKAQMGLDFFSDDPKLPSGRRTILFGLAKTHDGNSILFVKPETWGADHRLNSLFGSFNKAKHFVMHSLSFVHAQYVKKMRPGYDDQETMRKERIPQAWLSQVKAESQAENLSSDDLSNFSQYGLASLKNASRDKLSKAQGTYRTGREAYITSLK